ncbi:hypothetical protein [Streptomyces sp. NPDC005533]|uniref:hypothetical protein n=1 Tax=Streptomyces sp. NPDC005533 TaxID=3364723 RepID=UPI00368FCA7D
MRITKKQVLTLIASTTAAVAALAVPAAADSTDRASEFRSASHAQAGVGIGKAASDGVDPVPVVPVTDMKKGFVTSEPAVPVTDMKKGFVTSEPAVPVTDMKKGFVTSGPVPVKDVK